MVNSKWFRYLCDAFVHYCSWFLSYYAIMLLFAEASSKNEYADIIGWWCSLYVGRIRNIDFKAVLPLFLLFVSSSLVDIVFNLGWFYGHDGPTTSDLLTINYLSALFAHYLFFVSPIPVNRAINYMAMRFKQHS